MSRKPAKFVEKDSKEKQDQRENFAGYGILGMLHDTLATILLPLMRVILFLDGEFMNMLKTLRSFDGNKNVSLIIIPENEKETFAKQQAVLKELYAEDPGLANDIKHILCHDAFDVLATLPPDESPDAIWMDLTSGTITDKQLQKGRGWVNAKQQEADRLQQPLDLVGFFTFASRGTAGDTVDNRIARIKRALTTKVTLFSSARLAFSFI